MGAGHQRAGHQTRLAFNWRRLKNQIFKFRETESNSGCGWQKNTQGLVARKEPRRPVGAIVKWSNAPGTRGASVGRHEVDVFRELDDRRDVVAVEFAELVHRH